MLVRRLARPMLAAVFISGGIEALRSPKAHAKGASPKLDQISESAGKALPENAPTDPETLVKLDAAIKIGAGTTLALGKFPRLSALLLCGSVVPTTLTAHAFWEMEDPTERGQHKIEFLKNLGLLGGLLITSVDTHGKPSVGWRARRSARRLSKHTHEAVDSAKDTGHMMSDWTSEKAHKLAARAS